MGHRPYAVLAYGYDLTTEEASWGPKPAWFADGDTDWCRNAERALLRAKGVEVPGHIRSHLLRETCGVELVRLGGEGEDGGVILAAKKHKTDWGANLTIPHFELPDDADERLAWALGALGIYRTGVLPEWILAAHYS